MPKRPHSRLTLGIYINRIVKSLDPNRGIGSPAVELLSNLAISLIRRIITVANRISLVSKSKTLNYKTIEAATKLVLNTEQFKSANAKGKAAADAMDKYKKSKGGEKPHVSDFSVARVASIAKQYLVSNRKSTSAFVYLAVVVNEVIADLLNAAMRAAPNKAGKPASRVKCRQILLAIRETAALNDLFDASNYVIGGGVLSTQPAKAEAAK